MELTAEFFTTSRDDLVDLTRRLSLAINPDQFANPAKPLLWSVTGSKQSGKKIISDIVCDVILGDSSQKKGGTGDEYWHGHVKSRPFEIDWFDACYGESENFSKPVLRRLPNQFAHLDYLRIQDFMKDRKVGGITFVQNSVAFATRQAGIDISIENDTLPMGYQRQMFKSSPSLSRQFDELAQGNAWARYVTVTARDPRLLKAESFMAALNALKPQSTGKSWGEKLKSFLGMSSPTPVSEPVARPVYGQNFPKQLA